jgi:hypothetical protein
MAEDLGKLNFKALTPGNDRKKNRFITLVLLGIILLSSV